MLLRKQNTDLNPKISLIRVFAFIVEQQCMLRAYYREEEAVELRMMMT